MLPLLVGVSWAARSSPARPTRQALKRELLHRLGAQIECGKLISFVSHPYEHYTVDLFLYECHLHGDKLEARNVNAFKWVREQRVRAVSVHSGG